MKTKSNKNYCCLSKLKLKCNTLTKTSSVGTGPSPTWQSNITCETNNNHIIHKRNHINYHVCYVYIIAHLYGSASYNHEKVNFRLFNAYKRYKLTKVKDGNSAIN